MTQEKLPPNLDAMISLLDDPDAEAFRHVHDQIAALGTIAVSSLEAAWENSFNPVMQKRIEELVHKIQVDHLLKEFSEWVEEGGQDLLKGYILITRYQYPELDIDKILNKLQHLVRDAWLELNNNLTALEQVRVLNHIMFMVYKFKDASSDQPTPENYYINIVLESRQGTPLSIGMIYLIAAMRLNMPISGVDLPRYFVLAYTNRAIGEPVSGMDSLEVLFYVNPYARGVVFTRKELGEYLKHIGMEPESRFYMPATNVAIIRRLVMELQESYRSSGKNDKAGELDAFLDLLVG
jgi:regulator of sirC expression with transglutaminase-like and TPR domain